MSEVPPEADYVGVVDGLTALFPAQYQPMVRLAFLLVNDRGHAEEIGTYAYTVTDGFCDNHRPSDAMVGNLPRHRTHSGHWANDVWNRVVPPGAYRDVTIPDETLDDSPLVATPPRVVTFLEVYEQDYLRLVQVAALTTGSQQLAEDIVQDAFAELFRRWPDVRQPYAFVRRSVVSHCTSWVRRRSRERRHLETLGPAASWVDPDTVVVLDAMKRLSTRQRAAVVMRYLADWSEDDIATALGCRNGTVKSVLSRARAQLAKELAP